ncbi:MAG: hypothetical protein K0R17_319 [Rariglobus sp.]|jgi:hypothetical protein|nr:hypothetical protein [Rariglobus sp.]
MSNAFTGQPGLLSVPIDRKSIMAANPSIGSAAKWFWWIAALSLINTVLIHFGKLVDEMVASWPKLPNSKPASPEKT